MADALASFLKVAIALALVAALAAVVWNVAADETADIQDPSSQIDYSKFTSDKACEAVGGVWDATSDECTAEE